jgi:hypothetical protein
MSKKPSKAEQFEKAVKQFSDSEKSSDDVFELCVAAGISVRQGSGLIWSQVAQIIKDTYKGTTT